MFKDKTILVTGGTGSFGHTVVRKIIDTCEYGEIRIFSRDEKKQSDMRIMLNNPKVTFVIGDVRDTHSVRKNMSNVDYIFHAAALKQVPTCEFFPLEAVKTNIMGTENILTAAEENGVEKVVILSTDKAVYPINAMGISKAMMEKLAIAHSRSPHNKTKICGVRYGNVMYSRGSVIPLFMEQAKSGKDITVTNPSMTRFLLSLDHAVDLVLYAFQNGNDGDFFVRKAPACSTGDLAAACKQMCHSNSDIVIKGLREGEKLHETLVNWEELIHAEDLGDYFRIASIGDRNYNKFLKDVSEISKELREGYTSQNTQQLNIDEITQLLTSITARNID